MSECINIPFMDRFKKRMLEGRKTATSRMRKYGNPGDLFSAFGATFRLNKITQMPLKDVTLEHFKEEGFRSPSAFYSIWRQIHPKRYAIETLVWFHEFKLVVNNENPR